MSNFNNIVVKNVKTQNIALPSRQNGFDVAINPYTGCPNPCKYCYASFMRRFSRHKEQWGEFLDVKDVSDFDASKLVGKKVMIGSVTEPYNFFEKKYKNTREILKNLNNNDCFVTIFTKSDLVLRDIDLLKKMKNVRVAISLSTLDQSVADDIEQSYSVDDRLKALEKLHKEGIKTVVNISPILPYITDPIAIIERTKNYADEYIFEALTLRNEFKPAMINYVWEKFPDHFDDYNHIYRDNDFQIFNDIYEKLDEYCEENGIKFTSLIELT